MTKELFLGYDQTGSPVSIPMSHMLITGLTQVGKTETIKKLANEAAEAGYTVLLLDVKDKAKGKSDFADMGQQVPIFLKQSTEPLMLKGLLESKARMSLTFQFDELREISEGTEDAEQPFEEVNARIQKALDGKLHPIVRKNYNTLRYLFNLLVKELKETKFSNELMLKASAVNVMTLTQHSTAFKQLVVKTICEYVRAKLSNIVIFFDEAHIHVPQQYGSASKEAVTILVKEGASSEQYVVMADQTITEVEKDAIKQCEVWLLGRQRELNEAERTYKQLPYKKGIKAEDIMQLPKGFFIASTSAWVKRTYVKLDWIPDDVAIKIAKGELSVEDAISSLTAGKEDDDLAYKAKSEELEKENTELKQTVKDLNDLSEERGKELDSLRKSTTQELSEQKKKVKELEQRSKSFEKLAEALNELVAPRAAQAPSQPEKTGETPSDQPNRIILEKQQPVMVVSRQYSEVKLTQTSLDGMVAIIYADGKLPASKPFTLNDLNELIESQFGEKQHPPALSQVMTKLVNWGFFEKVKAGNRWDYKVKLDPAEAMKRHLLKP